MTDVYNMPNVFSCSDFLSDLWQGCPDNAEALDSLACPSEGGSTDLGRVRSADLMNLLGQAAEADSTSRNMQSLAASSSNAKESAGAALLTREPVESNLLHTSLSANQRMFSQQFYPQQASTSFPQADRQPSQLQPVPSTSAGQGTFHMDPVKQAHAVCNHGVSVTALQQQLAEMKSKASGLETFIRSGMQNGASPCFPEVPFAKQHTSGTAGTLHSSVLPAAPAPNPTPASPLQLDLHDHQLRQLASLLGSANVAALQGMSVPTATPSIPGTSSRGLSPQPASTSPRCHDHSSGDDDLQDLHKLSGLEDSQGDDCDHEHEHAWEAKLDKSLPPPEMKRMRRMLSNRESARRSRRRKQAHMQDLEVQNNELVEANEKLQKEVGLLHNLAKEAILEKKKSQTALETLKHQVVHLLGERNLLPKQDPGQKIPSPIASTGTDSDASGPGHLAIKVNTAGALPSIQACPPSPEGRSSKPKAADTRRPSTSPKAATSPRSGAKRKALEL